MVFHQQLASSHLLRPFTDPAIVLFMFMFTFMFVSFWVEGKIYEYFIVFCLYLYCLWRSKYEGDDCESINQFNPAKFVYLSQDRNLISIVIFCVQWFEVRAGHSFCWYWWNYWPSRFTFLFIIRIYSRKKN